MWIAFFLHDLLPLSLVPSDSHVFHSRPLHPPSPLDRSDTSPSPTNTCCGWLTRRNLAATHPTHKSSFPLAGVQLCPCPSAWSLFLFLRNMNRTCGSNSRVKCTGESDWTHPDMSQIETEDDESWESPKFNFLNRSGTNAQHVLLTFGQLF